MSTGLVDDHSEVWQKFHGIFWLHIYNHGKPPRVLYMTEQERQELDEEAFAFTQSFPHEKVPQIKKFLGVRVQIVECATCCDSGRKPCLECERSFRDCEGCWPWPDPCTDCPEGALRQRDQRSRK